MHAGTHLQHTQSYMSAWDVLTRPLGLPEMSFPLAGANSPVQPLTQPGARALQWDTNDLSAPVYPSFSIHHSHTCFSLPLLQLEPNREIGIHYRPIRTKCR